MCNEMILKIKFIRMKNIRRFSASLYRKPRCYYVLQYLRFMVTHSNHYQRHSLFGGFYRVTWVSGLYGSCDIMKLFTLRATVTSKSFIVLFRRLTTALLSRLAIRLSCLRGVSQSL